MSLKLWSYNPGSLTADILAERLDCKVLASPETSRYRPRRGDIVINYGNSEFTDNIHSLSLYRDGWHMINHPTYVNEFSNKLTAFEQFDANCDTATVPWATSRDTVRSWLDNRFEVVARHTLRGHGGEGIEILSPEKYAGGRNEIPQAPLYTMYIKKNKEYRVHMFRRPGRAVDFIWQQKKRRFECAEPNWHIRNYENGFIYAIDDVVRPGNWQNIQDNLSNCINLTFGAIDLITPNSSMPREIRHGGSMILEVNSAPGLQSETLIAWYVDHLQEAINDARA